MLSDKTKTEMAKRGNMTAQTVAEGHSPFVTYRCIDGCSVSFRLCRFKDTVKAGLQWCDIPPTELVATALDRQRWRTLSQSASSALEEERSPSSTVRQRTPPLGSLYPSDKCELPVPRLRTALQVQDRPAEPLPYPQIRGTDNVILETEGPP